MTNQLLALSKINGIGPKSMIEIALYFQDNSVTDFLAINQEHFFNSIKLNSKQKQVIQNLLDDNGFNILVDEANNEILELERMNIKIVGYNETTYPQYLKYLDDAPMFLYCKGNISLLGNAKNVAVVGTRDNTEYGKLITQKTVEFLVKNDYCIVSGLALGIDTIAHKSSLEYLGKTIAVLVDVNDITPKSNKQLAQSILDNGGLLVAENSPKKQVIPALFAKRDRIQTGLSLAVFPIETGLNGGTFYAINTGVKINRNIFAPDVYRSGYKDINIKQLDGIRSIIDSKIAFAYTKIDYPQILNLLDQKKIILDTLQNKHEGTLF